MIRLATFLALAAAPALASGVADERAVTFCVARDPSFVKVEKCLPDAHVGVMVLDQVRALYGASGNDLADRCLAANNQDLIGASICARTAVEAAVRLAAKLPEGSRIPDPLFADLSDADRAASLAAATKTAQGLFPERLIWGGTSYRPLP